MSKVSSGSIWIHFTYILQLFLVQSLIDFVSVWMSLRFVENDLSEIMWHHFLLCRLPFMSYLFIKKTIIHVAYIAVCSYSFIVRVLRYQLFLIKDWWALGLFPHFYLFSFTNLPVKWLWTSVQAFVWTCFQMCGEMARGRRIGSYAVNMWLPGFKLYVSCTTY